MKEYELERVARNARESVLRMAHAAKDSHIGCSLSAVDILTALYFLVLRVDPADPWHKARDRFILSKGHTAAALYAVLVERDFVSPSDLQGFAQNGSSMASHVERGILPGVETNGGSGGHGLSLGAGMALACRQDGLDSRVYVLMGDGELQEGSVWEAAMFASSRNLAGLTLIIDRNEFQTWSRVDDVVAVEPLAAKFRSFGWRVSEVDGHCMDDLELALKSTHPFMPHAIIAHTVKGRGVSFMEGSGLWHNGVLDDEQFGLALEELGYA